MNSTSRRTSLRTFAKASCAFALLLSVTACSGGDPGTGDNRADQGARAKLTAVEIGRLVDIFAWRRVDSNNADRLHPDNRKPVLIHREVVINALVQNEDPFANGSARFRFMPYDPSVGHRELLILWDDVAEKDEFDRAVETATAGLRVLTPYFAFNTALPSPPPLVARDACLKLSFDRPLGLETSFFDATPSAVQVLRLTGDPELLGPGFAYQPVGSRVTSKDSGRTLLVDLEVSGKEATARNPNPSGLPASLDDQSANIRLALPTDGPLANSFRVQVDGVPVLNSIDLNGHKALIRDFRAGNQTDPHNGYLSDVGDPQLVARKTMGITSVDVKNRILTINKRFCSAVIRGRLPFVDGPLATLDGKPLGPNKVPQQRALQNGDLIWQDIVTPDNEVVRVKGEVIRNFDIPVGEDDTKLAIGGGNPTVRLQLDSMSSFDAQGREVFFRENSFPLGSDCTCVIHYAHQLKVSNGAIDVGDSKRVYEFLSFNPTPPRLDANRNPVPPNTKIDPLAEIILSFSKPMGLDTVRSEDNVVVASKLGDRAEFIDHIKVGNLAVVPTLPADLFNDSTSIRLTAPLGLFHVQNTLTKVGETYYVHVRDGVDGARDRAGHTIDLFDEDDIAAVTMSFKLDYAAEDNLVGWVLRRMNGHDEDGTKDAVFSSDVFGQYQMRDGRLYGWPTSRFSRIVDQTTLSAIRVDLCGACIDTTATPPVKRAPCQGVPNPAFRYQTPLMLYQNQGGISEPLVAQGSRVQMTYREDDFQLSFRNEIDLEIDVEQLYWGPFVARAPALLTYDLFDRVTIQLGTAEKRPDMRMIIVPGTGPNPPCCTFDGATYLSGLTSSFTGNYIDNGQAVEVVKDAIYEINPNNAFQTQNLSTMVGYPKFSKTYTWRDRRYMAWDLSTNTVLGLGGSQNPSDPNVPDRTRDVTSPHIPEANPDTDGVMCHQLDDYLGAGVQDHSPFALPLLVDWFVYPDDPENSVAKADNLFQIGYIGPLYPANGHGYYNPSFPALRAHTTGGIDPQLNEILVDPKNTFKATGGWLNNALIGRFKAPWQDDHIHHAVGDFVRKLSVVTYGYIDTLQPGRNDVSGPVGWNGDKAGYPNLADVSTLHRPAEWSVLISPAPEDLPVGTKLDVEYRGCDRFDNSSVVWEANDTEVAATRGNLLNPHFACEQYRYQQSNRVSTSGIGNYVKDPDLLMDPKTLVAPRFINWRFTFVNNTAVTPARVPYIDFMAITYRMKPPK